MLFDPEREWTPQSNSFQSKSSNSPWINRALRGKVTQTFVSGKMVFDNGKILRS